MFAPILEVPLTLKIAILVTAPSISALPVTVTLLFPLKAETKFTVPELLVNVLAPLVTIPPAAV